MEELKKYFYKQGGWKLIRQYWKNGSLATAIVEFLLLGKSRTALEILRLTAELKTKKKLCKKYSSILKTFDESYIENKYNHIQSNKIWVCWFQGLDNAPDVVKCCIKSLVKNLKTKEIVVIDSNNIYKYTNLPDYIISKWKNGIITNTHMTDLLRLELLTTYGGTWIDSTVLCTEDESNIPNYFFNSDLFFYQCLKPGRDGHSTYLSSWYINATSHNKILEATKTLCWEYWKRNDELIDYFLLHDFISMVLDYYPNDWEKIVPRDNATPHELLLRLFDDYDETIWKAISRQSPFHKLSYKFDDELVEKQGTFYKKLIYEDRDPDVNL